MQSDAPRLRALLAQVPEAPSVFLPHIEAHPAAWGLGLAGAMLGAAVVPNLPVGLQPSVGWVALLMVVLGSLIWAFVKRPGLGWHIDLATREVRPQGVPGEARVLQGEGWSLVCVAGSKRRSLALEFRHEDGGRPIRVLHTRAGASREEHQLVSQLADALAQRLNVARGGLTL